MGGRNRGGRSTKGRRRVGDPVANFTESGGSLREASVTTVATDRRHDIVRAHHVHFDMPESLGDNEQLVGNLVD